MHETCPDDGSEFHVVIKKFFTTQSRETTIMDFLTFHGRDWRPIFGGNLQDYAAQQLYFGKCDPEGSYVDLLVPIDNTIRVKFHGTSITREKTFNHRLI